MLEFVLIATLVSPSQPTNTYTPPRVIYSPPPATSPGGFTPSINPTPAPQTKPTPAPLPRAGWQDKMWERYKQQSPGGK